jgi:beta-fructofuranosidase
VLEVFVNERTVISTRIYYPSDQCFEPRFFADSENSSDIEAAVLLRADVWDGLGI